MLKITILCIFIFGSGLVFSSDFKNKAVISDSMIVDAQSNFNNKCGHCHGKNGASPISERDLRKLSIRYKDQWKNVAYTTIVKGRSDYGMPIWGGILPDHEIQAIVEFLVTVQPNGANR